LQLLAFIFFLTLLISGLFLVGICLQQRLMLLLIYLLILTDDRIIRLKNLIAGTALLLVVLLGSRLKIGNLCPDLFYLEFLFLNVSTGR
jgi:hypothetical protein